MSPDPNTERKCVCTSHINFVETRNAVYKFKQELEVNISQLEDGDYEIECPLLQISSIGVELEEALDEFAACIEFIWNWYSKNEIKKEELPFVDFVLEDYIEKKPKKGFKISWTRKLKELFKNNKKEKENARNTT